MVLELWPLVQLVRVQVLLHHLSQVEEMEVLPQQPHQPQLLLHKPTIPWALVLALANAAQPPHHS